MRARRTSAIAVAAIAGMALALPASGSAVVTIGSTMSGPGNDNLPGFCPGSGGPCTGMNLNLPASNVAAGGLTSPIDGVVVRWRVKSGSADNPVALRVLRPAGGASYTGAGTSDTGTTTSGTAQFSSKVRIHAGDSVGLDISNSALVWNSNPGASALLWGSVNGFPTGLADGTTAPGQAQSRELLMQADVEPDVDTDGLGDETQDGCPTEPGPVCTGGGPDTTPPAITDARAKPKRFAALTGSAKGRAAVPVGTTFLYTLSEPATVTIDIERGYPGRKVNGRCVRPTKKNSDARRCTRYLRIGGLDGAGAGGPNSQPFTGNLGRRVKPGRYHAVFSALDGSNNDSQPVTVSFTVVKPQR